MTKTTTATVNSDSIYEKKKKKKSYADWLTENGIASQDIYHESLKDIDTEYKKAAAEYGARAERLASSGLIGGGYSDYLSSKAYEIMQKSKLSAKNDFMKNEKENRRNYESYLSKLYGEEISLYKNTEDAIIKNGIAGYDDAFSYATKIGLSEEMASEVATRATKIVSDNIIGEISQMIIKNKLSDKEAAAYAIFQGLSEDDAKKLAEFAKSYNHINYNYGDSYLDFIEKQTKGN